jgi:hypothetical protein
VRVLVPLFGIDDADWLWIWMRGWRCWAEAWLVLSVCWSGLIGVVGAGRGLWGLGWWVGLRSFLGMIDGDEPESLILAQSERWRNA